MLWLVTLGVELRIVLNTVSDGLTPVDGVTLTEFVILVVMLEMTLLQRPGVRTMLKCLGCAVTCVALTLMTRRLALTLGQLCVILRNIPRKRLLATPTTPLPARYATWFWLPVCVYVNVQCVTCL